MEEKIQKHYLDLAEIFKALMADIPRVFEGIAKERDKRKPHLEKTHNN